MGPSWRCCGLVGCLLAFATPALAQQTPSYDGQREGVFALADKAEQHRARGRELLRIAASQTGRAQGDSQVQALEHLRRAAALYTEVTQGCRALFAERPADPRSDELRGRFADALYWTSHYDEAARVYGSIAASTRDARLRVESAFLAVKSQESWIRLQAQLGTIDACTALRAGIPASEIVSSAGARLLSNEQVTECSGPPVAATVVRELPIPEAVQTLIDLRRAYVDRVPAAADTATALGRVATIDTENPERNPPWRPKFAYLNARTLMRFGHAVEAEAQYRSILATYCADSVVASAAFDDINNLYVLQGRQDEPAARAREEEGRACLGRRYYRPGPMDPYQHRPLTSFFEAERAPPSEAVALYERAAREMEAAVNANPNHREAALATYYIALAYERAGRFATAARTYQRITRDFNHTRDAAGIELTGEDLTQRINILEVSSFRAAVNLERMFDFDDAIRFHYQVASDPRFARAAGHADHVHDALASIALINTNLDRWEAARAAWVAFAPVATPGMERAEALFRAAEAPFRGRQWREAVRSLGEYVRGPVTADNAMFHVRAWHQIAESHRQMGASAP